MILLAGEVERRIRAEGEKCYPEECCGIVLGRLEEDGKGKKAEDIVPLPNTGQEGERHHRFRIGPDEFLRVEKEARLRGLEVIGFYHSHPDHPSAPSEHDREQALPFYSYIILSVQKGAAAALSSWELSGDRARFLGEHCNSTEKLVRRTT
jgi:proteasome lid subunit RPN8/RPN11